MDIFHRITFNASIKPDLLKKIKYLDVPSKSMALPRNGGVLVFVDISESDPRWGAVSEMISLYGAADMVETFFTEEEIRAADWLRMISTFEQGYPQPKPHWPLKQLSYEILCPKCAIRRQTKPLRVAKEPSLRTKSFMSLIWMADILCVPEVIQGLNDIQAVGFEPWDVLIHKTNTPSEKVKQLYITSTAHPGLVLDPTHKRIECPECGTVKHYPHVRGKMKIKQKALLDGLDFMLTAEWFGHGYLAWKEILVSKRVASFILEQGWKGIRFKVVEAE